MFAKRDEKGIVLVSTLILMVLGAGLVVALLKLTTHATKLSGLEQQYTTAIEASKGGTEVIINMIKSETYTPPAIGSASAASGSVCLQQKLTKSSSPCPAPPCLVPCLASPCWTSCGSNATSSDPTAEPDITMSLSGYSMFLKVVDTKESEDKYMYSIKVRSVSPATNDQAEISFLYQIDK